MFKKTVITTMFFSIIISSFISCTKNKVEETYFESMNTFMKVQAYGKNAAAANEAAQKYISDLEATISVTKPISDIYKINHATSFPVQVSDQTMKLIKIALNMSKISNGAFNPCLYPVSSAWGFTKKQYRIPPQDEIDEKLKLCNYKDVKIEGNNIWLKDGMQFDLGGIGKGFAGDEAAKKMKEFGINSALLDLGGNIQLIGRKPNNKLWNVGIKNPFDKGTIVGTLKAEDCAIITSAGYERYFEDENGHKYIHIFDGTTGAPVENDLVSTTAIASSGTYCDGLSTTLYVLGLEKSIELWKTQKDFDFIMITKDKKIYISKPIAKNFTLNGDLPEFEVVIVK